MPPTEQRGKALQAAGSSAAKVLAKENHRAASLALIECPHTQRRTIASKDPVLISRRDQEPYRWNQNV
jgi:hypothetical protein